MGAPAPSVLRARADFERVLARPPVAKTAHFALHHLRERPAAAQEVARRKLSTIGSNPELSPVDDSPATGSDELAWLGLVVPKRHAKRAVTRNLFKRHVRAAARELGLPSGLWVVRLRSPFARERYRSAASAPLAGEARQEARALIEQALNAYRR